MVTTQEFVTLFSTLEQAISQVIEGKPEAIRRVLTAFFAGGHVLLEDLPGVGKTRLAQTLARALDAVCHRIQFTPDMLPNDIIGVSIYNDGERAFQFMPGPVFANENLCAVRKCAVQKGFATCGDCKKMEECPTLGLITANHPDALKNLKKELP